MFSTCFETQEGVWGGFDPTPPFFDVFRHDQGGFDPTPTIFNMFHHEQGGFNPTPPVFDVSECFNTLCYVLGCRSGQVGSEEHRKGNKAKRMWLQLVSCALAAHGVLFQMDRWTEWAETKLIFRMRVQTDYY